MTGLLVLGVVLAYVLFGLLIHVVREFPVPRKLTYTLAGLCALSLIVMLLSDWPTDSMNIFWADHSILASVVSTLFLLGLGYLFYEAEENKRQEQLASGLSGAGLGGIVDHLVDAEVALSYVSGAEPPPVAGWDAPDKPLRWMRSLHDRLARDETTGRPTRIDPRYAAPDFNVVTDPASSWRSDVIDQTLRRLLAAMRDWSTLIGRSDDGTTLLLILSEVRKDLMELSARLRPGKPAEPGPEATALLVALRQRLRVLAYFCEELSRNPSSDSINPHDTTPLRPEVLTSMWPLPIVGDPVVWEADEAKIPTFGRRWGRKLDAVLAELRGPDGAK